jgi:hypothetical protein
MPIAFIALRTVFVLAWTIGDVSSSSCQLVHQAHFGRSMPDQMSLKSMPDSIIMLL